jgi:iron complex transport system substrate-binding protein
VHRVLTIALTIALVSCSTPAEHRAPTVHHHIVALMPSFVDDLVALGAARRIVGVSTGSENIAAVRGVPRVATSASVDVERIVALRPDLIVAIPAQMRFLVPLQRLGYDVVSLPDDTYPEIFTNLEELGELTGRSRRASTIVAGLQRRTRQLRAHARRFRRPATVFFVLGTQPIWTAGPSSYIGTLISLAGGRDIAHISAPYSQYSAEALLRDQPDAIVTDATTQIGSVLGREPWRSLHAVARHHVFVIRDPSLLERPGPHYVEGLAWLISALRTL